LAVNVKMNTIVTEKSFQENILEIKWSVKA